jgi:hypothetical protein
MSSTKIGVPKIKRRISPAQCRSSFFPPDGRQLDVGPRSVVARAHWDYDPVTVADGNGHIGIIKTWHEDGSPATPS